MTYDEAVNDCVRFIDYLRANKMKILGLILLLIIVFALGYLLCHLEHHD